MQWCETHLWRRTKQPLNIGPNISQPEVTCRDRTQDQLLGVLPEEMPFVFCRFRWREAASVAPPTQRLPLLLLFCILLSICWGGSFNVTSSSQFHYILYYSDCILRSGFLYILSQNVAMAGAMCILIMSLSVRYRSPGWAPSRVP